MEKLTRKSSTFEGECDSERVKPSLKITAKMLLGLGHPKYQTKLPPLKLGGGK